MKKYFYTLFLVVILVGCSNTNNSNKNLRDKAYEEMKDAQTTKSLEENEEKNQDIIDTSNLEKAKIVSNSNEIIEVEVEGVGAIQDGDRAKARDEAIWDAQRRAVEKGVGTFLSSDTLVQNAQLLEDNIYTQANGYVKDYEIKSEKDDEYLYYITIKAKVEKINLGNKLFLIGLIKKVGDPRIMVIIPEYYKDKQVEAPAAESAIIKYFVEAGYRVVDQTQIKKIRYSEKAKQLAEGNTEAATNFAEQFGADILIAGKATSVNNGEIQGMVSSTGRLQIRGIKVDTGEIAFAESIHSAAVDLTEKIAAKKALRKAGEIAANGGTETGGTKIKPITQKLAKVLLQKPSIQILITNANNELYQDLTEKLKDERTVKNAFAREFSNSVGRIDIDYDRSVSELTELIKTLINVPFEVTNSTKNKITIKIIKPKTIVLASTDAFNKFKNLVDYIEGIENIKVKNKEFSQEDSTVEITTKIEIYEIADILSKNYSISKIDDNAIYIK